MFIGASPCLLRVLCTVSVECLTRVKLVSCGQGCPVSDEELDQINH